MAHECRLGRRTAISKAIANPLTWTCFAYRSPVRVLERDS